MALGTQLISFRQGRYMSKQLGFIGLTAMDQPIWRKRYAGPTFLGVCAAGKMPAHEQASF